MHAQTPTGPSLILLNKHILKDLDEGRGFNFPMFLSCLGLISSTITSHVLVRFFGCKLQNQDKMDWAFYMKVSWSSSSSLLVSRILPVSNMSPSEPHTRTHHQNVAPVGLCQALTLALGNAAYLYLTVSFIQMLKAFTPVVVLAIGIVFGIEKAEPKVKQGKYETGRRC
jgi:drug/metabolite transporter (DMT)-like permease